MDHAPVEAPVAEAQIDSQDTAPTADEALALVKELRALHESKEQAQKRYEKGQAERDSEIQEKTELLKTYADANPQLFSGRKSFKLDGVQIGYKAEAEIWEVPAGKTWDELAARAQHLKDFKAAVKFSKPELNKTVLRQLGAKVLAKLGLKLVPQPDKFYIKL